MIDKPTDWVRAEKKIVNQLGLRMTIASGRTWADPGDGTTTEGDNSPFRLMTDSKATQSKSYAINRDFMNSFRERSFAHGGKEPLLHIEFQQEGKQDQDWVLVSLDFFGELWDTARQNAWSQESQDAVITLEKLAARIKDPSVRAETYAAIKTLRKAQNG